jgi:hypothetical protein
MVVLQGRKSGDDARSATRQPATRSRNRDAGRLAAGKKEGRPIRAASFFHFRDFSSKVNVSQRRHN